MCRDFSSSFVEKATVCHSARSERAQHDKRWALSVTSLWLSMWQAQSVIPSEAKNLHWFVVGRNCRCFAALGVCDFSCWQAF
jgi:uncharacterized membrane protein YhdT